MVPLIKAQVTSETSREFLAVTPGTAITLLATDTFPAVAQACVQVTDRLLGSFSVAVTC
jgi:hypothetical protein